MHAMRSIDVSIRLGLKGGSAPSHLTHKGGEEPDTLRHTPTPIDTTPQTIPPQNFPEQSHMSPNKTNGTNETRKVGHLFHI